MLVSLALLFAVVDLIVGGYLLWYARSRQRHDRESVAVVGELLLLIAGCLTFVSYQVAHRPVVVHHYDPARQEPDSGPLGSCRHHAMVTPGLPELPAKFAHARAALAILEASRRPPTARLGRGSWGC